MARRGWGVRRRQQARLVLRAIATLAAAIGLALGVWWYSALIIVLFTPAPR
jgi:hypothetical protein